LRTMFQLNMELPKQETMYSMTKLLEEDQEVQLQTIKSTKNLLYSSSSSSRCSTNSAKFHSSTNSSGISSKESKSENS